MSTVYLKYFGLAESPFAITPDPSFVYLSPAHRDALAHLLHGVGEGGSGGFVQLTGEVGTGKTTMCRCLLDQLPAKTRVALILNPLVTPREMLATICEELGIDTRDIADSSKALVDALNAYLLQMHADGWRVVVVIDEAQNLSPESLEQVRLLTNLETAKHKLLQMVLLGQPELRDLLQRQDLRQLAQRITARYHLKPLDEAETAAYVRHRMEVAGSPRNPFTRSALKAVYNRSGGVPRLINIIADRALAGAYTREALTVSPRLVNAAADEVSPSEKQVQSGNPPWLIAAGAAAILLLVTLAMVGWPSSVPTLLAPDTPQAAAETAPATVPEAAQLQAAEATQPAEVLEEEVAEPVALPLAAETLDAPWLDKQHALSWHGMASLWQDADQADAIRTACEGGSDSGFACVRTVGNWSRIERLGLPVILLLQGERERRLLLRGFGDSEMLVGVNEEARWIPRSVIEQQWLGSYFIAWPQAPDWPLQIRRGETGEAVDIVLDLAARAELPWQGGDQFNQSFEDWLKAFQTRHGLDPDGIVGPVTLLHLMAPTISSPRLANRRDLAAQES